MNDVAAAEGVTLGWLAAPLVVRPLDADVPCDAPADPVPDAVVVDWLDPLAPVPFDDCDDVVDPLDDDDPEDDEPDDEDDCDEPELPL